MDGCRQKDVGMVIHYDISDSLENYVQEAGRAGRDESISADCYVRTNDERFKQAFYIAESNQLSIQEIQGMEGNQRDYKITFQGISICIGDC